MSKGLRNLGLISVLLMLLGSCNSVHTGVPGRPGTVIPDGSNGGYDGWIFVWDDGPVHVEIPMDDSCVFQYAAESMRRIADSLLPVIVKNGCPWDHVTFHSRGGPFMKADTLYATARKRDWLVIGMELKFFIPLSSFSDESVVEKYLEAMVDPEIERSKSSATSMISFMSAYHSVARDGYVEVSQRAHEIMFSGLSEDPDAFIAALSQVSKEVRAFILSELRGCADADMDRKSLRKSVRSADGHLLIKRAVVRALKRNIHLKNG